MNISVRRLTEIARGWYSFSVPMTEENEEQTQLISTRAAFRSSCCDRLWILVLGLVLVIGVSVSTYLLVIEGREPSPDSFTLVLRDQWSQSWPRCRNGSKLDLPVQRILLLTTNTTECGDEFGCMKSLRNIERQSLNKTDIPYNFIAAGDQRIYEGRGWNCSSKYVDDGAKLFTVALLGKYDDRPVPPSLVKIIEAFLTYSISQNLISPCYQILTQDSRTRFITDVAFELEQTRTKNIC